MNVLRLPPPRRRLLALTIVAGLFGSSSPAQEVDKDHAAKRMRGLDVFTKHVRPVLVEKCVKCHGGKATEGGLDLSDRDRLLKGGESGPAVLAGKGKDSLLYKVTAHLKEPHMPHQGRKLPDDVLARLAAWIDDGAPFDAPLIARAPVTKDDWTKKAVPAEARQWWSFQPLRRPALPKIRDESRCLTPVDRFLLEKLEAVGIRPNESVDRRRLARRASFDLTGLPPMPHEVESFVSDPDPDAYPKLIDRLLASPRYGERWARHWLDLARFAESHGFEHDTDRPTAYPYRDFVIKAFNAGMPYDRFVKWQIAGDEYEPDNPLALSATGYLAAGPHSTQITKNEVEKHRYDELDDQLATAGTSLLGLTVGCARCHDHKFDPVPQADYYRLLSAFTTTVRTEVPLDLGDGKAKAKALVCSEGLPALRLHTQGDDFLKETHFLRRGDPNQKEGVAAPGFLQVLTSAPDGEAHWRAAPPAGWRTSYRRRALAEWLTDVDGGAGRLLARVIVNRLWQHHMGRGLVATVSDFGNRGDRPTHPELLDWLATELIANGWRLKPIHKLLMTSAAYSQDSRLDEAKAAADRDNRLCWRRPSRRLEGEAIRDSLLAAGGALDARMYGPGTLDDGSKRRSVYFTVKRSKLIPMLQVFDGPDALSSLGERPTTTVAPQALYLMNNPHVRGYARGLARRVAPDAGTPTDDAVRAAYQAALGRPPTAEESAEAAAFVRGQSASYAAGGKKEAHELALTDFCQTLLCLNEFVYVD